MLSSHALTRLEHPPGKIERETRIEAVLRHPHGIRAIDARTMISNGVSISAVDIEPFPGRAWHDLSSERSTLLIVFEEVGGTCDTRVRLETPASCQLSRYISYVPAGMQIWGYTDHLRKARTALLRFDFPAVVEALGEDLDARKAQIPTLMFADDRITTVGKLLATECTSADDLSPLYIESLLVVLFTDFLRLRKRPERPSVRAALAPRQLRRVTEYMEECLSAPITLAALAGLTGLSQSHFGRAFKASTGLPPHQWLLRARIRRAQQLLLKEDVPMADIAFAAGFSEQSHFNRAFRRIIGSTPGEWRRNRGATY